MLWTLNNEYNPNVVDETGKVICSIHGYGTPEGRHNARMICAAPEMYRLLKTMCDAFASFSYGGDEKRAEKILRKIDNDKKEKIKR